MEPMIGLDFLFFFMITMETILKKILSKKPSGKMIFQGKDGILVWKFGKKYRYTVNVYPDFITVSEYTRNGCHSSPYYGKLQRFLRKYLTLWDNVEKVVRSDFPSCYHAEYFRV